MDAAAVAFLALWILSREAASLFGALRRRRSNRQMLRLLNTQKPVTPEEFFRMREAGAGRENAKEGKAFEQKGVYVLTNTNSQKKYVGQGIRVGDRIARHFTGKGNEGVYRDYRKGDRFLIRTAALSDTGFRSLNEMERCAIASFKAFQKGYNKTRGNR
ncbi:MAG: GIY-YIG nuclease family protein [Eubacteriaceae bacterium]|nr:GIY-YIG nuclease family protein [Eubacteriaceae bacterium]